MKTCTKASQKLFAPRSSFISLITQQALPYLCQQIHVDRYKHSVYSHLSLDPFLKSLITRDERSTRFHACERFDRCEEVEVEGRASHTISGAHVVYVNPVMMSVAAWQLYLQDTKQRLSRGEVVNNLVKIIYISSLRSLTLSTLACTSFQTLASSGIAGFRRSL